MTNAKVLNKGQRYILEWHLEAMKKAIENSVIVAYEKSGELKGIIDNTAHYQVIVVLDSDATMAHTLLFDINKFCEYDTMLYVADVLEEKARNLNAERTLLASENKLLNALSL